MCVCACVRVTDPTITLFHPYTDYINVDDPTTDPSHTPDPSHYLMLYGDMMSTARSKYHPHD